MNGFDGGDRSAVELPAVQQQLVAALATTGKPLVVVLMNGSALALQDAVQQASAILEAWYPGESGGTAIAETLFGENNPSGRLPLTFYASTAQLPAFDDYAMNGRTYRYFTGTPLYQFGYGLSYTNFEFEDAKLASSNIRRRVAGIQRPTEKHRRPRRQRNGAVLPHPQVKACGTSAVARRL